MLIPQELQLSHSDLCLMARIVLPSETLNYFSPVRVEQTSTETHIHLDERMPLHYPMMCTLNPKAS